MAGGSTPRAARPHPAATRLIANRRTVVAKAAGRRRTARENLLAGRLTQAGGGRGRLASARKSIPDAGSRVVPSADDAGRAGRAGRRRRRRRRLLAGRRLLAEVLAQLVAQRPRFAVLPRQLQQG